MKTIRYCLISLICAFVTLPIWAATELSPESHILMQSAMRIYIDHATVPGGYPVIDLKTGKVRYLHPTTGHPETFQVGDNYVLCTNFKDDNGKDVHVDVYLAPRDKSYSVFHVEVENHAALDALTKIGVAKHIQEP